MPLCRGPSGHQASRAGLSPLCRRVCSHGPQVLPLLSWSSPTSVPSGLSHVLYTKGSLGIGADSELLLTATPRFKTQTAEKKGSRPSLQSYPTTPRLTLPWRLCARAPVMPGALLTPIPRPLSTWSVLSLSLIHLEQSTSYGHNIAKQTCDISWGFHEGVQRWGPRTARSLMSYMDVKAGRLVLSAAPLTYPQVSSELPIGFKSPRL